MARRPDLEEALRAAVEVAQAQRARLDALRVALRVGDMNEIVRCAREVVGMEENEPLRRPPPTQLITADKVAELLHLSKQSVYELARTKQLPSIRIGRKVRFDPGKVHAFLEGTSA